MSESPRPLSSARVAAVLGPTNTGKTHFAVERMLGHASGMIGLPLRLLAREIYDRVVKARGVNAVALITGEEKIVPPRAHYFICTVEAMPLAREVEFLAIDEIQLCADRERGHLFTDRLLHARGTFETLLLGASTMAPLVRRLLPGVEIVTRERFSALSHTGPKKLSRLPRRSAVVAFSADEVYAIAELIRRQRGGAAVVMGSLSPRTRNAQVELYQSGEVDFLVATDAIGMGLNMDLTHVAFAGLEKFDGRRRRPLSPQEVGQIAGRAGRYRRDGTFGTTATAHPLSDEIVAAVEGHTFEPVTHALWRNPDLDFASLDTLIRSLSAPAGRMGLKAAEEALDERTLRRLAEDPDVRGRCEGRAALHRLWDACQTPDFRKTTPEEHFRLARNLFDHLTSRDGRVPESWMAEQYGALDRSEGEIDALSARLAGVRTLAYVAHRPNWLANADPWRERARALEARLSDALHERLMARFVDRRTSALIRGLAGAEDLLAGVSADGVVTVEGHVVGRLTGLSFSPEKGVGALETKALRAAAERAVAPEMARRLGDLARAPDEEFTLLPTGEILWRGEAAGALANDKPFRPRARLHGQFGVAEARERAERRLEAFVAAEASRAMPMLKGLEAAIGSGGLRGLARGVAWRLVEGGGVLARRSVEADLLHLSRAERRSLRELGVVIGAFALYLRETDRSAAGSLGAAFATQAGGDRALGLRGRMLAGEMEAGVETIERLAAMMRRPREGGAGFAITPEDLGALGWSEAEAGAVLRGLGFFSPRVAPGEARQWRRRSTRERPGPTRADTPFAALAALTPTQAAPRRRRRRKVAARV